MKITTGLLKSSVLIAISKREVVNGRLVFGGDGVGDVDGGGDIFNKDNVNVLCEFRLMLVSANKTPNPSSFLLLTLFD